jgi:hypothetical protein
MEFWITLCHPLLFDNTRIFFPLCFLSNAGYLSLYKALKNIDKINRPIIDSTIKNTNDKSIERAPWPILFKISAIFIFPLARPRWPGSYIARALSSLNGSWRQTDGRTRHGNR